MLKNKVYIAYCSIILACTIWGLNGVFVNILDLPYIEQTFFRLSVPFIFTGIILLWKYSKGSNIPKIPRRTFITMSVLNAVRMYFLMMGYILTTIGNAAIAQRSNVFIILILAFLILGERLSWQKILSIMFGFIGLIIISSEKGFSLENTDILGIGAIVISAGISAYLNIQYKQQNHTGPTFMIFTQSFVGAIVFGITSYILYPIPSYDIIGLAILHSFLIGVVGFYLFFSAIRHIEISKASILTYFEVFSAVIFGSIFLDQIPSFWTYIGILCIVLSGMVIMKK